MPRIRSLSVEKEEDIGQWRPIKDADIYHGQRLRIRELYATGLTSPQKAGKAVRRIANMAERIVIADVTRVMLGTDGHTYVVADIVEGHPSLRSSRIRHRVQSGKMTKTTLIKEILVDPSTGPSDEERRRERPVDHSRRVRTKRFHDLLSSAIGAGVPREMIVETLEMTAQEYAEANHRKNNEKLVAAGKPPLDRPTTIGDFEFEAVGLVLREGREPEYWMFPIVQAASDDPAHFIDQNGWRIAA